MLCRYLLVAALSFAALPSAAVGQAERKTVDAAAGASGQLVQEVRSLLLERYVLPDVAVQLDEALEKAGGAGDFAGLSGEALAARVTEVMSEVTPDGHLRLIYQPALAAALPAGEAAATGTGDPWDEALERQLRRTNAGIRNLEVLPGNIRYLAYDSFGWGAPVAEQAIATAMEFARGGDAIVIDLRNNPGGSAYAEAALASYFLPPQTPLARFELRGGEPAEDTLTTPAPFSLSGTPTYVLTSAATLSAAELFATHVETFGFGTLVGERTGGAAYTVRFFPLSGGYVLNISVGRTADASTGVDWEQRGVEPAIEVPSELALDTAAAAAMRTILNGMEAEERSRGERLLIYYSARANRTVSARPPSVYAGSYGDFIVDEREEGLSMRFGNLSSETLQPIGTDLFAAASDPGTWVRFLSDAGAVTALEVDSGNGPPVRIPRQAAP